VIRRWGWVTLVLTPDEKLIARAFINAERDGKPAPSLSELAKAVGVKEADVKRGLAMLERYEILKKGNKTGGIDYAVIPRYIRWEPRLDFVFHNITLDSGRQFSVNSALDVMLLVSGKLANEKVTVDDSSPESTARIRVVFDKGKLASQEPASTVFFLGGG